MRDEILKIWKFNRRIRYYIVKDGNSYMVCTGKPSDLSCLSWSYDTLEEAERNLNILANNYADSFNSLEG